MKSKTPIIALIVLLVILVIAGLYFGIRQFNLFGKNNNFVDIPLIQTSLVSETNKKSHTLEARFTLDVEKFKDENTDSNTLHKKIESIIKALDYDKLAAEDGTKYIKDEIAKNLSDFVEPEDLKAIYITDIISDAQLEQDTPPDRRTDVFKGLFENVK